MSSNISAEIIVLLWSLVYTSPSAGSNRHRHVFTEMLSFFIAIPRHNSKAHPLFFVHCFLELNICCASLYCFIKWLYKCSHLQSSSARCCLICWMFAARYLNYSDFLLNFRTADELNRCGILTSHRHARSLAFDRYLKNWAYLCRLAAYINPTGCLPKSGDVEV